MSINEQSVFVDDMCALSLVRRLAASLDIDPLQFRDGQPLPHGWHLAFFSIDAPTADLRTDGMSGLGIPLPDLGYPNLVFGERNIRFGGDILIGDRLRRVSKLLNVSQKNGRSGPFAVVKVEHQIFSGEAQSAVVTEELSFILRHSTPVPDFAETKVNREPVTLKLGKYHETVVPSEIFLFRISAVMFNAHRIHYDIHYAREVEGYSDLVVNGSVSALLLASLFTRAVGKQPRQIHLRNLGIAYCGRPLHLNLEPAGGGYEMWALDDRGNPVVSGSLHA